VEHEGDYYRTRLTHSIEVAQVARTISRVLGLNEDLAEAVALAHDFGHTPFGHTGEDALAELMAPYGGFDHNAQALKIVTSLERKYAQFDGLNLTWESLEGIAKHNGPVTGDLPYALAEYDAVHDLELHTHAGGEAQTAALADDIAYNNHDLDDGLRAGLFTEAQIEALPMIGEAFAETDRLMPGIDDPVIRRHDALGRVFGKIVEDVIIESQTRLAALNPQSVEDIRHAGAPIVQFSPKMWENLQALRAFLFKHMYRAPSVLKMRERTAQVVVDMFEIYMDHPELMPEDWRHANAPDKIARARSISDYISGMTDRYALKRHKKLIRKMDQMSR